MLASGYLELNVFALHVDLCTNFFLTLVMKGSRKSLLNVFQDGNCHPEMAMVIDDRFKVWEEKDQPRVHVVPPFSPYYAPQAETANAVPVLCVARNVACNVRGGFFKEFDESLLRRISDVFHEDDVVNLPSAPDVSNYLISEDSSLTTNGHSHVPIPEGMNGAETAQNLLSMYTMVKNPIASILDSNKLSGSNYADWLRNLKLVLDYEKLTYVLDKMPPKIVPEESTPEEIMTIEKWRDDDLKARWYMLESMTNELRRQHEYMMHAADIHMHLQELYGEQLRTLKYNISKELFRSRMREGSSVHDHVLKMIGLIEKLATFDVIIENDLAIDLILQSLADSFDQFVANFNMYKMSCSLVELLNLLSAAESTIKKDKPVMLMDSSSKAKKGFQPKNKKPFGKVSQKVIKKPKMKGPKTLVDGKEQSCFHCGKPGHWKRNCKEYIDQKRSETGDGKKHQA